jgi:nitric oxide reductase NorD protein
VYRLAQTLGQTAAGELVSRLVQEERHITGVLALIEELEDASSKAATAAMEALSDLDRRVGLSLIMPWLDLGVTLAETSGATALKYFKDSPVVLGLIEPSHVRPAVLTMALELAEQDANLALEYVRTSPRILAVLQMNQMKPWLELGLELVPLDVVVGLEYIRQIPALAPLLPVTETRDTAWANLITWRP